MKAIKEMDYGSKITDLDLYKSETISIDSDIKKVFDTFLGLYYLPPYFWYILINKDSKKFADQLFDSCNKSHLIWNQMTFNILKKKLSEML